jgi:Fe-S cluster biogenesis protein NfuA
MTRTHDAREEREFRQRMGRIETLVQEVERFADPAARAHTKEIVQAVLDLHGAGLERLLEHVIAAAPNGAGHALVDRLADDDVVAGLLLLHGLHPVDLRTRVARALDHVRPYLHSHGGNVELVNVDGGVVRLRMQGSCHGCPSSSVTLKLAIEEAIYDRAPDVTAIEVEGALPPHTTAADAIPQTGFIPVEQLLTRHAAAAGA